MELVLADQLDSGILATHEEDFRHIAEITFARLGLSSDVSFSVILVDDEGIHAINREYRGIDRPTDVITFALRDEEDGLSGEISDEIEAELGDVFINRDAVKRQAEEYGHSERRELCFLFTHGLLHLLGFDHMTEADEHVMFGLQKEILDPYIPR